jgi:hypothetical protein
VSSTLLTDLQVAPRRDDFAQVLDDTETNFIKYRRWHAARHAECADAEHEPAIDPYRRPPRCLPQEQ